MGAEVAAERVFPDHHRFGAADLAEALRAADLAGCELVATTEKDAVRLPPAFAQEPRLRVVRVDAEIVHGGAALDAALEAVYPAARPAPRTSSPAGRP
jgi:tetraacyldisaccharide 4'-kinase